MMTRCSLELAGARGRRARGRWRRRSGRHRFCGSEALL